MTERVTLIGAEILAEGDPKSRITLIAVEVLTSESPPPTSTQVTGLGLYLSLNL